MSLRRKIFYGFTLFVIAMLVLLPQTGWLARLQLSPFSKSQNVAMMFLGKGDVTVASAAAQNTAGKAPSDFGIQIAYALTGWDHKAQLSRLNALTTRFPHSPQLIAAQLRVMTVGPVHVNRTEELLLLEPEKQSTPSPAAKPSDPDKVAIFIALAEEGERLQPENAYFPMMASVGYYAVHQDSQGDAAWIRASEKPIWEDFVFDEATAKWKLQRAMNGGTEIGAMARMSSMAAILLPHYAQIRAATRLATVRAVLAERAGNREAGFHLRHATRLNGQSMQSQGKWMITSLVGRAMIEISGTCPGGAEPTRNPFKGTNASERWLTDKRERYQSYLASIGHPEEASAFAANLVQGAALRQLDSDGNGLTYFGFGKTTYQYFGWWVTNLLLLTGAMFALAFAAIFKLVYRFSPRLQQGEPLQASAKWGLICGLIIPLLTVAAIVENRITGSDDETLLIAGGGISLLLLIVPPLLLRFAARQIGHGFLVLLATATSLIGLIGTGAIAWQMFGGVGQLFGILYGLSDWNENGLPSTVPWLLGGLVLAVPFALLCLFGVFSKILRIPPAAGITRGMRAMAVPLAAVLMLTWGITLLCTLQQEHRAIAQLDHITTNGEPRVLAELLHRSYPK